MMASIASITIDAGLKRVHPPLPVLLLVATMHGCDDVAPAATFLPRLLTRQLKG